MKNIRDAFSKKYAGWLTAFGCLFLVAYLFVPPVFKLKLGEDAKIILGFVMGTIVSTSIKWALGTSKTSEDKTYLKDNEQEQ